jgi:hypothetical protein
MHEMGIAGDCPMRARAMLSLLAVTAAGAISCSGPRTPPEPEPVFEEVPIRELTTVDLLFVIDNSYSMAEEQAALARYAETLFSPLIQPESGYDGVVPPAADVRVGVISTDMGTGGYPAQTCADPMDGDAGVLQNVGRLAGCQEAYTAADCESASGCPWLSSRPARPDDGSDGTPAIWEDFACIALLGTSGCGVRQPLEASYQALVEQTHPGGANEGFLRDDSLLAVIYVTTDDDCSFDDPAFFDPNRAELGSLSQRCLTHRELLHPTDRYGEAFLALRDGDADHVVLAAVAGIAVDGGLCGFCEECHINDGHPVEPPPGERWPSCETAFSIGYPPVRLTEWMCPFYRDNVLLASICRSDWSPDLGVLARAIQRHLASACVDLPEGVSPTLDCRLFEIADDGREIEVPHLSVDAQGWSVEQGVEACPRGQLRIAGEPARQNGFVFECRSE